MISPEIQQILLEMGKTQYGHAVKNFLNSEIKEIGNVLNAESWDDTLGRQYAVRSLSNLLNFIEGVPVSIKKDKNQYV